MDIQIIIMLCLSYLIGSIPSGVWIGKIFYHKDPRDFGSGNMGTTNTFRVLGKKAGTIVLIMDMFKGTVAGLLPLMFHSQANAMLIGLGAIIGHVFPIFAGFKGGKAVATSVGVLLVYNPPFFFLAWIIFLTVLLLSSMVSVASMVGFTIVTVITFFFNDWILTTVAVVLTIFIYYRHFSNLKRIFSGQENLVPFGLVYYLKKKKNA
ncbi:glycerol-3-phosphate 1-O-acyltransferase PlsY [Ligilactobacillus equi]|uniref:Glycerol-3-phosphate acyltransferase n=2 Tax=Ligilactobacillus equi TaxID=137357 RepID=V7HYV0_9LACO|nr:glycerol-3-phosphate 1-O-acyltransferase PlsY [Ligilactobacillus equi]ETA74373.1 hypothetical protein LEQ_2510 [Ligilactobacillus equi DPC 6820]